MQNNKEFLISLIENFQGEIFKFCFFLTQNKSLAEDMTQETFLRGIEKADQLKDRSQIRPWLKAIARNIFLDYRKSSRVSLDHQPIEDFESELMSSGGTTELQIATLQILSQLSEEERFILILIDVQESSYEEAAIVLNCPVGTVKSKLSRARQAFAEIFNKIVGTKRPLHSSIK